MQNEKAINDPNNPKDPEPVIDNKIEVEQLNPNDSFSRHFAPVKLEDKWIEKFLVILSLIVVVMTFPISLFCIFVVVRQFERVVILRNGKVHKNHSFGPGLVYYLPCVDLLKFIDLRILCYAVPPQEALTKDSLTVSVDAVVYYKIRDPVLAVISVANYKVSTQLLAATTLRNALGNRQLTELLGDRPAVSYQVLLQMNKFTNSWGIHVLRVDIKDIRLPLQLQKAMATEAESSRLANAKIIVAKAEIESTKNLQKASAILADNPMCMQVQLFIRKHKFTDLLLRFLQSLHMISGENTHTVVFPFPANFLKKIFQ